MSKRLRLKTLLDRLAPAKLRARDHTDMPPWAQSTRTMPWTLWFGKPDAYTHAIYIRPCPNTYVSGANSPFSYDLLRDTQRRKRV